MTNREALVISKQLMAAVALLTLSVEPLHAASLTLYDDYRGQGVTQDAAISSVIWTLTLDDNCVQCNALLTAQFSGSQNYYVGSYIDSVQWSVEQPDAAPTAAGFTGFYVNGIQQPASATIWLFAIDESLGANQCNSNSKTRDTICGEWIGGGTAAGFGAIATDMQLAWTFETTFASELGVAQTGNIRAAFNRANGKNYNIFSPEGGSFDQEGCTANAERCPGAGPLSAIPEPSTVWLLGTGVVVAALVRFLRRPSAEAWGRALK